MKKEAFELEKSLKTIKDAELDIELLVRKNEKLCADNNNEIKKFEILIGVTKGLLESELKESGEKKLECKFGDYVGAIGFKEQPDRWIYVDEILMSWIISLPKRLKDSFLNTIITIKKLDLKKQIIADNSILFEKNNLIEDEAEIELFIANEERSYKVEGIEIKRQDPKFSINIKKKK